MNLQNAHREMIEWMDAFGQDTPENPTIPSIEVMTLRTSLIEEETNEAIDAIDPRFGGITRNYELALDGLGDSLFVIIGTLVALGVDTQEVWNEILKSNWTKFWTFLEIKEKFKVDDRLSFVFIENKEEGLTASRRFSSSNYEARNWLVKNEKGKVIKSPSFTPPDLKRFLPKAPSEP